MADTIYTEELAEQILDRLAAGESMVQICKDEDMPGLRTVMRWAKENEAFGIGYAHAREAQAEVMDDKILNAADAANAVNAVAQRVKVEAYKWRAAKLAPKRYGDATTLKHADADGNNLPHVDDTTRAIRIAAVLNTIGKGDADNAG
jgi:hypothetical protein